ncbi:MAG: TfoX/Sxy family protein [Oscillospiraceae bacterium]|nr:TfoX/Sxy family protein [Oscillospiraceae bacterium]
MGQLANLPNIGKVVEEQLNSVGITTTEQLIDTGAETAWLKIRSIDESACIHRLLALEGAIRGIKKTDISAERKAELKDFYNSHKR